MTSELDFGDYIVASANYVDRETAVRWDKGEIALVFSRRKRATPPTEKTQHYDLLFENGRTAFTVDAELIHRFFSVAHSDPDFVIDGCSTNPGWAQAHLNIENE